MLGNFYKHDCQRSNNVQLDAGFTYRNNSISFSGIYNYLYRNRNYRGLFFDFNSTYHSKQLSYCNGKRKLTNNLLG